MVKQGEAQRIVDGPQCFLCLRTGIVVAFSRVLNGHVCKECATGILDKMYEDALKPTADRHGKQRGGYHARTQNRDS